VSDSPAAAVPAVKPASHAREILRLAVPAFGALIAEPLFLLADSAIVGHLGTDQLAGLGIAATVVGTAISLCIFLAYGTTAAVARRIGAGDAAGALRLGVDGLWLAGLLGVLLGVVGFVAAEVVVGWFDPDEGVAICPRHGSRFDVRTGRPLSLPAYLPVETFEVRVAEGVVRVEVP